MSKQGQIRVGISGWRFDPWRGTFYPEDLPQKRELEYASRKLNSIELNGTFYSTQKPQSFQSWRKDTKQQRPCRNFMIFKTSGGDCSF